MAATGHRNRFAVLMLASLLASAVQLRADDSADIHAAIGEVATALSSGDPALAMRAFSKSYTDYDQLSNYFDSLTGAYSVENQIGFTDEELTSATAIVKVDWAMTLTARQATSTKNRNADMTLKLTREGKHWRIIALDPISIFDPQN